MFKTVQSHLDILVFNNFFLNNFTLRNAVKPLSQKRLLNVNVKEHEKKNKHYSGARTINE